MRGAVASVSGIPETIWSRSRNLIWPAFLLSFFATWHLQCARRLDLFFIIARISSTAVFSASASAWKPFSVMALLSGSVFFSALVVSAAAQAYVAFDSASASSIYSAGSFTAEQAIAPGSGYWCRPSISTSTAGRTDGRSKT